MIAPVNDYFKSIDTWKKELLLARDIALACDLTEDFKWKHPCYTHKGKNIVLLQEFKDYCAILFPKGSLLKDTHNILTAQTENAGSNRQIRITTYDEIRQLQEIIKDYIIHAIAVESSGQKIMIKDVKDYHVPDELLLKFQESPELKEAFYQLTSGRQKGYLLFFSGAKQSATRTSRIEKSMDRIMMGKGIDDCICGKSKHMPRCDGSHKNEI